MAEVLQGLPHSDLARAPTSDETMNAQAHKPFVVAGELTIDLEALYEAMPRQVAEAALEYLRKNQISVKFLQTDASPICSKR
jgi:hypothetical protein